MIAAFTNQVSGEPGAAHCAWRRLTTHWVSFAIARVFRRAYGDR